MVKKVAIQGGHASFHDRAARKYFGEDIETVCCDTFSDVFSSLSTQTPFAVVAIENSLYGSINEVYDLLLNTDTSIVGEIYQRVQQCIIGLPNAKIDKIREVHSHPVALAQCSAFLDTHLPFAERFEHTDTALSVRDIKKWGDETKAAIASKEAAALYDVPIIAKNIETNHQNYTRFVVLEKGNTKRLDDADKTSLVLKTHSDTQPGALYQALGIFAERNLNLTLLHSRPIIGKAWHYMFYVDIVDGVYDGRIDDAIVELKKSGYDIRRLGSYASGKIA